MSLTESPPPYLLAGATATGKTSLVHLLAERHHAHILSADAMLVYRGMDIGTAKPTPAERQAVPYGGLDCVTPAELFSTARWLEEAEQTHARAVEAGAKLFVTGGTGLYYSALLRGLDPTPPVDPERRTALEALPLADLQKKISQYGVTLPDMNNPRRLVRALEILESGGELPQGWGERKAPPLTALTWDREHLHARIASRVHQMYAEGLLEETRALLEATPQWSRTAAQAIGYAEAIAVLQGTMTTAEAMERTIIRTRQLARRQETYLRHQFTMRWLHVSPTDSTEQLLGRLEELWGLR